MYHKSSILADKGYVVLGDYEGTPIPAAEWGSLEYMEGYSEGRDVTRILSLPAACRHKRMVCSRKD